MYIHPSLAGLSEEFGIDLEYLVDQEMREALSESEGDLTKALDRYVIKTSFRDYIPRESPAGEEARDELVSIEIELSGRYDEATLSDLAFFAFYVAHRLFDFTKVVFDSQCGKFLKGLSRLISRGNDGRRYAYLLSVLGPAPWRRNAPRCPFRCDAGNYRLAAPSLTGVVETGRGEMK